MTLSKIAFSGREKFCRILREFGLPAIHFIGDSHVCMFTNSEFVRRIKWNQPFDYCKVGGATVSGLQNPNTKTQAMPTFQNYLKKVNKNETVVICLGEVDCGFVLWYKNEHRSCEMDEQLEKMLLNMRKLVEPINCKVVIIGVPLPTILGNEETQSEVANLRSSITASVDERTQLTLKYNVLLKQFCEHLGFSFIDLGSQMLDKKTGIVDLKYINSDPNDHHANYSLLTNFLHYQLTSVNAWTV